MMPMMIGGHGQIDSALTLIVYIYFKGSPWFSSGCYKLRGKPNIPCSGFSHSRQSRLSAHIDIRKLQLTLLLPQSVFSLNAPLHDSPYPQL